MNFDLWNDYAFRYEKEWDDEYSFENELPDLNETLENDVRAINPRDLDNTSSDVIDMNVERTHPK